MNYYKRHLGDYARKAGHLSMLEHGAYTLILDAYYDREQAPTKAEALRWARARNPDETQTVSTILQEFFFERDGRYYQQRVEDELDAARAKAEHNRAIGKLGGRPPRGRKTHRVSSGLPDGFQTEPQSTNPLIQDLEEEKTLSVSAAPKPDDVPAEAILAGYRELLPSLPQPRKLDPDRKKKIIARWHEDPERQTLDWWRDYFGYVAKSDFLTGRTGWGGCGFDWLIAPKNMRKVVEGNYENRGEA